RDLAHALEACDDVLDLAGEDVLAARDDHVVVAPLDRQPARAVEAPHVAGRHQPLEDLLAAAARVAVERRRAPDEDAPRLAVTDRAAVGIEQLDDDAR